MGISSSFMLLHTAGSAAFAQRFQGGEPEYLAYLGLPLLVVLRTYWSSGTRLMAFSSGLVTVTIILSTGCKPASAMTLILGNVTSGNKEVCSRL